MPLQRATGTLLRRPSLLIIGTSALSLMLAALTALSLWEMRLDALAHARDAADNLAPILRHDITRNVEMYGLSLQVVINDIRGPAMLALPPNIRWPVLFDRSTSAQDLGSLPVTDKADDMVIDSHSVPPRHIYLGDRDYFLVCQASDGVGLYINEPFVPRTNGLERSPGLSRRLNGPRGEFNDIVVGTLRLNYFRRLFDGINLGFHTTVTLIHTDDTLSTRRPYNEKLIGHNLVDTTVFQKRLLAPGGSYVDIMGIDGIKRLFSSRHIDDRPLIITAGLATGDIYAERWRRAWVASGIVLMLDAVFIALSFLFAQQLRKRLGMEQQLHLLADTDSLTGLGTRRTLDPALDVEWRRANRHYTPMAVLMIDVDDFKPYNNRYGHAAGGTTLRTVARYINDNIKRPGDFADRYGSEEFCAVLPNTDLSSVIRVAEVIRAAVLTTDRPNTGSAYGKLTVSISVAVHSGVTAEDDMLEDLVRLADERLYEAKAAGRNVVPPRQERPKLVVVWPTPVGYPALGTYRHRPPLLHNARGFQETAVSKPPHSHSDTFALPHGHQFTAWWNAMNARAQLKKALSQTRVDVPIQYAKSMAR